ncbi:50S ribosomal protein L22 [Candidatus Beckwithbacteria bacterium]|nr:50S ribosomal protein L22 [Candidatus Beckwithbacteria bacterium]
MEIVAYQKSIRMTPRKLRLVADSVRSLHPSDALVQLQFIHKRAAKTLYKVLKQAISNAVNNHKLSEQDLVIKHILIENGPTYKRFRAGARGRARSILKRTSHIKFVLEAKELVKVEEHKETVKKEEKPVKKVKTEVKK